MTNVMSVDCFTHQSIFEAFISTQLKATAQYNLRKRTTKANSFNKKLHSCKFITKTCGLKSWLLIIHFLFITCKYVYIYERMFKTSKAFNFTKCSLGPSYPSMEGGRVYSHSMHSLWSTVMFGSTLVALQ